MRQQPHVPVFALERLDGGLVVEKGRDDVAVDRIALLAQGAGRLIRRATDRGVVAMLDPRLVTKRYGSFLKSSLPDFWMTTDGDVAVQALRRLRGEE